MDERIAHFRLLGRLGAGGMGVVYRARDEKLERDVAIKVINDEHLADPEYRKRFVREAKAAAAVKHPGVATVYEIREEGDKLCIVMELIAGQTLRVAMGSLTLPRSLEIGAAIADALGKAHDAGVVHRDIKPENVIVTDEGVKVLDFGIARRQPDASEPASSDAATQEALSTEGSIIGTAGYMSPEQALGKKVGPASDVFSLGVVLYEMISGRRPFGGGSFMETAIAITRDEPDRLGDETSAEVAALVHRCLDKTPSKRPTAAELAERLRRFAGELATGAAGATVLAPSMTRRSVRPPPKGRSWWLAGAAAAIVAMAAVGVGLQRSKRAATTAASASSSAAPAAGIPITALPITGTDNADARAAYEQALADFRRADYDRAKQHLREAVAKDPGFALAQLRLAHAEAASGETAEARKRFQWIAQHEAELDERHRAWLRGVEALEVHDPADYRLAVKLFQEASQTWPTDAELRFMIAATELRALRLDEALEQARLAVELDPAYADALQIVARLAMRRGETEEAMQALDACVNVRSNDCLFDRIRVRAREGQCNDVIADVKLYESSGGGGSLHTVFAASALLSQGETFEAAEGFLQRGEQRANSAPTRWVMRTARLRSLALRGRFDELQTGVDGLYGEATSFETLAELSTLAALGALETGDDERLVAIAERFLSSRHVAAGGMDRLPTTDPSPLFWRELRRAGRLTGDDLTKKLETWRAAQHALGFEDGPIWFQSEAFGVSSPSEAKDALANRPDDFVVAEVQDEHLGWDALGRIDRLTKNDEAAKRVLGKAAKSCTVLLHPFEHVQALEELGETYETLQDNERACAAYRQVTKWWGDAKPRSRTGDRAASRIAKLACKVE